MRHKERLEERLDLRLLALAMVFAAMGFVVLVALFGRPPVEGPSVIAGLIVALIGGLEGSCLVCLPTLYAFQKRLLPDSERIVLAWVVGLILIVCLGFATWFYMLIAGQNTLPGMLLEGFGMGAASGASGSLGILWRARRA